MPKDFGFLVLVFIAVSGFSFFSIWFSVFAKKYERFFGFVIRCAFWVFLFCPIWLPVFLRFELQLISNRVLFIYLFNLYLTTVQFISNIKKYMYN